jgi:hypothetical protein
MVQELISKKTRYEFREYFVGTTLREIEMEFDAADVPWDEDYTPAISGQRRTLVEQYYHAVDFTKWSDVKKILTVYENVLTHLEEMSKSYGSEAADREFRSLKKWLEKDGFVYANGKLSSVGKHIPDITETATKFDAPALHRQIDRLRECVDSDPDLAIGTAKELIETTCLTILEARGVTVDDSWEVPRLVKETRQVLDLVPDNIPNAAKGAEVVKRLLSNLGTIAQGLGELRNLYGTGHGRSGKAKGLTPRHARLAVGAASTLATFLFETHETRS